MQVSELQNLKLLVCRHRLHSLQCFTAPSFCAGVNGVRARASAAG